MNETLAKFWLFATHWTELDVFETEEELNDEIELLHRKKHSKKEHANACSFLPYKRKKQT